MEHFGLSDLAWIAGIIVVVAAIFMEIPQQLVAWGWPILTAWASALGAHVGASTGASRAVPPQQHQAASALVPDLAAVLAFLSRHNLSDEQAIDLLTELRREDGEYLISANKIRDVVGGNEAIVKARVASRRPKPPVPKASGRIERPVNGW